MAKFHINPKTGNPGTCTAEKNCPYGDLEADHYPTPEIARTAYEVKMKTQELEALQRDHKASEKLKRKSSISDKQIENIKRGNFNNRSVSFRRSYVKPGSGSEKWFGKLTGEPDDVDLAVTFTKTKVIATLSWEGKIGMVDSIPLDNADELSEQDKGEFMLKITKKAKSKYADRLAKDREEVFKRAAEFDNGEVKLNGASLTYVSNEPNQLGYTEEGSRWVAEQSNDGWKHEVYVHRGIARVVARNQSLAQVATVHSATLTDGFNSFANGTEAARFLVAADKKARDFRGF